MSEEEMRKSYQEYMLGKTFKSPVKSPTLSSYKGKLNEKILSPQDKTPIQKQTEKRCWQTFNKFCATVKSDWIGIDAQMLVGLKSLQHTIYRVRKEVVVLNQMKQEQSSYSQRFSIPKISSFCALEIKDVENALYHDLNQQETLLKTLRKLLAQYSETVDYLGRVLDDAMHNQASLIPFLNEELQKNPANALADELIEIFCMISRESYRKQDLCKKVLNEIDDTTIVETDEAKGGFNNMKNENDILKICLNDWKFDCEASHVDLPRFEQVLEKAS